MVDNERHQKKVIDYLDSIDLLQRRDHIMLAEEAIGWHLFWSVHQAKWKPLDVVDEVSVVKRTSTNDILLSQTKKRTPSRSVNVSFDDESLSHTCYNLSCKSCSTQWKSKSALIICTSCKSVFPLFSSSSSSSLQRVSDP